jgi:opacity protein-like surface antigen
MKKLFFTIALAFAAFNLSAQDGNRNIGVGLQSSFPIYGLSAKIGITDKVLAQAVVAPFNSSSGDFGYSINFYGVRGIYRFTDADNSLVPYGFAGVGLIRSTLKMGSLGSTSSNMLGWNLGAGLEYFPNFLDNLGVSVELGYGAMNVSSVGVSVSSITAGGGIHYYFN